VELMSVDWKFIDKCAPGAKAAWDKYPALPVDRFLIGMTGSPRRAIARDRKSHEDGRMPPTCECHDFIDGEWRRLVHTRATGEGAVTLQRR
jgi:hypothetical protein